MAQRVLIDNALGRQSSATAAGRPDPIAGSSIRVPNEVFLQDTSLFPFSPNSSTCPRACDRLLPAICRLCRWPGGMAYGKGQSKDLIKRVVELGALPMSPELSSLRSGVWRCGGSIPPTHRSSVVRRFARRYGLSVHEAASVTIARRAMGDSKRPPRSSTDTVKEQTNGCDHVTLDLPAGSSPRNKLRSRGMYGRGELGSTRSIIRRRLQGWARRGEGRDPNGEVARVGQATATGWRQNLGGRSGERLQ